MWEYVLHRIDFDRNGHPFIDRSFAPIVYDNLDEALAGQSYYSQCEANLHTTRKRQWYIEHRIKLDYGGTNN